ncbi:helix-turn-helix domain-containing protein [Stieleria sp. JC731]|uniref:HTH domain-containing protein n=1 Tax=Pirellulaceae TaxID=2691357 RepID=UPI001E2C463E|nr:helix-turn-helix domain-containing protein [Stieleria sp. JC731]MCC9603660.1 helix-turn-helix domain-containing protein [Stieleria sp. JC731]
MRHRLDRALEILRLVQSGVAADPHAITSKLNVNRRTFYRDIAFLKELGVEISFDHREGRYRIDGLAGVENTDGSETFQQVIGQAIRQSGESSTVVSIVRHAAAILTGDVEAQSCDGHSDSLVDRGVPARPLGFTSTLGHQTTFDGWVETRSNLGALTNALDQRKRIQSISGDPDGNKEDLKHLIIHQITISAEKVIVEGVDQNGRLVRTTSSYIRMGDDGPIRSIAAEAVRKL